jgi:arginyl-tRNA synthetase
MVFATAKLAGYLPEGAQARHVMFGSVLGPDKKMLKTREGGSVKLRSLIDEAVERALQAVREKNPELGDEETRIVAGQVGCGALKYVDLSSDRIKDYVFDWDRMLAFEGNTGPYLQYAHARIRSIERRAAAEGLQAELGSAVTLEAPEERALGLSLLDFELTVIQSAEALEPHRLCTYLYELAGKFTSFYNACPVLKAEAPAQRKSRLSLLVTTRRALALGLELLGIVAPERM